MCFPQPFFLVLKGSNMACMSFPAFSASCISKTESMFMLCSLLCPLHIIKSAGSWLPGTFHQRLLSKFLRSNSMSLTQHHILLFSFFSAYHDIFPCFTRCRKCCMLYHRTNPHLLLTLPISSPLDFLQEFNIEISQKSPFSKRM